MTLSKKIRLNLSVVIITYRREDYLLKAIKSLRNQTIKPKEIIIVDASPDNSAKEIVKNMSTVIYLINKKGYGHMPLSRTIGARHATGDIIAFIDDDAFPEKTWAEEILKAYKHESIGAVGGRAYNDKCNEETKDLKKIGAITKDGFIHGYFAMDSKKIIKVDHLIGCNMSFRKTLVEKLNFFRDLFPGTCLREDSDIALRVKNAGYKILFNPKAAVLHLGAPHPIGQRFDVRYRYYAQRNHLVLLLVNYGIFNLIIYKYLLASILISSKPIFSGKIKALANLFIIFLASLLGIINGLWFRFCMLIGLLPR